MLPLLLVMTHLIEPQKRVSGQLFVLDCMSIVQPLSNDDNRNVVVVSGAITSHNQLTKVSKLLIRKQVSITVWSPQIPLIGQLELHTANFSIASFRSHKIFEKSKFFFYFNQKKEKKGMVVHMISKIKPNGEKKKEREVMPVAGPAGDHS